MAERITNYQCPACTGPLRFDELSGKLQCDYCESSFTVQEVEDLFREKNEKAEQQPLERTDEDSEWGEDAERMRAYNCPSCGAELICEETTAATSCPYCGNPTIVPGQFSGSKRPVSIIPFKVTKEQAIAEYDKEINLWGDKWVNDEIDDDTYYKNCPDGYEIWSCPYCSKWTLNYYY